MAKVLIIDDDQSLCEVLSELIESIGYHACYALSLAAGEKAAATGDVDLVLLDVRMPDGNGIEALQRIKEAPSQPEIIVITGAGDPDSAELAIKNGAWDYIQKPLSPKNIVLPLTNVLEYRDQLKTEDTCVAAFKREGIIGQSPQLIACIEAMGRAAGSTANILVTGETGTGKELFARALHENSPRAGAGFVVVDCAALATSLAASVLFGHERGAYTGAEYSAEGLVKLADGGTLFLDEIGELNLDSQKIFLRVLQEHAFRPVGSKKEQKSDFRLISATNRNLDQMVREGTFREDLLYRLRTIAIEIPPLRERVGDIEVLTRHYARQFFNLYGLAPKEFSRDFFETLRRYNWPGNTRELISAIEDAVHHAGSDSVLYPQHLPQQIRINVTRSAVKKPAVPGDDIRVSEILPEVPAALPSLREFRDNAIARAEETYLRHLMMSTKGNLKQACQISDLGRTRLYLLLKKYNISRTGWPA